MARREELLISRSSTFRSRRALVAASCAGVGGGREGSGVSEGDIKGLVVGSISEDGTVDGRMGAVVRLVDRGEVEEGDVMSLLSRFLWAGLGLVCTSERGIDFGVGDIGML
jgi:hypothetical protein